MEPEQPVVLLIDDDARNRALVRECLRGRYVLLEAESTRQGLALIEAQPVDLVLLDVMMPEINGYEGCRQLKAWAKARGEYLPVLLVTSMSGQEDRNHGLQAGADDFLAKPVNRHELSLRVQTFLKLRHQERLLHFQIDALKSADALKDDLVSLLVHDLRNPLSGITGILDAMSGNVADADLREDLRLAVDASGKLREILEDILHVRRFESGALELERQRLDADLVLRDAISSVTGAARACDVRLTCARSSGDPWIQADPKLVRRALENLLSNAIKYSPRGGVVTASVADAAEGVEIQIGDRGAGVPERFKNQLFKKFGSVEAARGEARRGFGLGLHLVDLVATAHGGRAMVRDREGGGTVFGIFLPRAVAPPVVAAWQSAVGA